jgi:hypothetical protein
VSGSRYQCPSFVAEFLLPWISQMDASDATIQKFVLDEKDPIKAF